MSGRSSRKYPPELFSQQNISELISLRFACVAHNQQGKL